MGVGHLVRRGKGYTVTQNIYNWPCMPKWIKLRSFAVPGKSEGGSIFRSGMPRFHHVIPLLNEMHWFQFAFCAQFTMLVITTHDKNPIWFGTILAEWPPFCTYFCMAFEISWGGGGLLHVPMVAEVWLAETRQRVSSVAVHPQGKSAWPLLWAILGVIKQFVLSSFLKCFSPDFYLDVCCFIVGFVFYWFSDCYNFSVSCHGHRWMKWKCGLESNVIFLLLLLYASAVV